MRWRKTAAFGALLSFTVPPAIEQVHEEPLAPGERRPVGPLAATWTKRSVTVSASRLRLNGLGARTHANWVLFRAPFDTTETDRLRHVRFTVTSLARTDVAMLRIGSLCFDIRPSGQLTAWAIYTASGIDGTESYRFHPLAPTRDPTIIGVNVPTRLANYVACHHGENPLRDRDNWQLRIDWEER